MMTRLPPFAFSLMIRFGVVRVSLAHYNTTEEVARFGEALGAALRGE